MRLFQLDFERKGDFSAKGIIMSQFVIPNRNLSHQRQGQVVDGGEGIRSSHVQNHPSLGCVVPMSTNHGVTELTWKNGHPSMHGLSNVIPSPSPMNPTTCSRPAEHTLESIVHQATCQHKHSNLLKNMIVQTQKTDHPSMMNRSLNTSTTTSNAGQVQMLQQQDMVKKRLRSETESDQCGRYLNSSSRMHDLGTEINARASASATFCRENSKDTTLMTWASFESPATLKTKTNDDDSASHGGLENRDEEQEAKGGGCVQTCSARRSRSAAIHNQSERRRRDRINQKLKALQKLVPNASKNDKASMLDEVIEYLKQLQAQVHVMRTRAMPAQLMMMNINNPAALAVQQQQQQLQMSLLAAAARLGMSAGMGLGFLDVNAMARTAAATPHPLQPLLHSNPTVAPTPPAFLPPPFVVPPALPPTVIAAAPHSSGPLSHPYSAFLAQQTADMDFYRKMAVLYRQQANPMLPSFNQG